MKYTTIVVREDHSSIAIVTADTLKLMNDVEFFAALRRAITNWFNDTEEGEKALVGSGDDFNVGDLSDYLKDFGLVHYFAMEGIMNFDISITHMSEGNNVWRYDTHLFNVEDVEVLNEDEDEDEDEEE
jgi:hypothetical protein